MIYCFTYITTIISSITNNNNVYIAYFELFVETLRMCVL